MKRCIIKSILMEIKGRNSMDLYERIKSPLDDDKTIEELAKIYAFFCQYPYFLH